MKSLKPVIVKNINGGGEVAIFPPDKDSRITIAFVSMNGERYPAKGFAVNKNQTEAIFVIEGKFAITINNQTSICSPGSTLYFEDGASYSVKGKGRVLVAISPAKGGKTEIVNN